MSPDSILAAEDLSKCYGPTWALHPSSVDISAGSIHGLLGKNGAGKSTLVGMIAGSVQPSSGRILFKGRNVTGQSLARRRERGIRLLDQHAQVAAGLTVAENLLTPSLPRHRGLVSWKAVYRQAGEVLASYSLDLPVQLPAGALSVANQRKLNLVKTLMGNAQLVMLDEPTTALTHQERSALFDWIRQLRTPERAFVFISHFTQEIRELCDEYTVLRDGGVTARGEQVRSLAPAELSQLVTGAEVREYLREPEETGTAVLETENLAPDGCAPISLTLGRGEVVGLAGLTGSGAEELARALSGLHPVRGGKVRLLGKQVRLHTPTQAAEAGIAYLPNDRIGEGLISVLGAAENVHIGNWPRRGAFLDNQRVYADFAALRDRLALRVRGGDQPVAELSGGNQQKVLLGRLLQRDPTVLVLHEPTVGVDISSKEEVHRLIGDLAHQGCSVLLLAYDIDELSRLSDRVLIFRHGDLAAELESQDITVDQIHSSLESA